MPVVGEGIYEFLGNDARLKQALATNATNIQRSGVLAEQGFTGRLDAGIARTASRFDQLTSKSKAFGAVLSGLGLGAGLVGFQLLSTAVSDVTGFFTESIGAASKAQAQIAVLTQSVKINDAAWDGDTASVERAIKAGEELGFTHEEQAKSLGLLVAQTHSLNNALEVQRVAMDVSRLTGKDLGATTLVLGKAYDGITTSLRRWGIVLPSGIKGMEAIAAVEKIAAGSAKAFADTTAGAQLVLSAKFEALQIQVGNILLPVLAKLASFTSDVLLPAIEGIGGAIGAIVNVAANLPLVGIIFDHIGESVAILALALTAKLGFALAGGIRSLLGYGAASAEVVTANEEQAASSDVLAAAYNRLAAAIETLEASTGGHIAAATAATTVTEEEAAAADDNAQATLAEAAAESTTAIATEGATIAAGQHVGALDAEATAADGATFSVGLLRGALLGLLIGIPILSAVKEKVDQLGTSLFDTGGDTAQFDKLDKAIKAAGLDSTAVFGHLSRVAAGLKVSTHFVYDEFQNLLDSGLSVDDALKQIDSSSTRVIPLFTLLGGQAQTTSQSLYDTSGATNAAADSFNSLGVRAAIAANDVALATGKIVPAFSVLRDEIVSELGGIDTGFVQTVKDANGKVVPLIDNLGTDIGIHLKDGSYLVTSAASVMAHGIPAAVAAAGKSATAIASLIPGQIGDAILAAQSQLMTDLGKLGDVANRVLVAQVGAADVRKQIADLEGANAAAITKAQTKFNEAALALRIAEAADAKKPSPSADLRLARAKDAYAKDLAALQASGTSMTAAQKLQLKTLELQLAGYLLEIDPKSKEAAGLLAAYEKSNDAATRSQVQKVLDDSLAVYLQALPGWQEAAAALGIALPDQLILFRNEAGHNAALQVESAIQALDAGKDPMFRSGMAGAAKYADGIDTGGVETGNAATGLANKAKIKMDIPGQAFVWGQHVGDSFAGGLTSTIGTFTTAAQNFVDSGSHILQFRNSPPYTHSREMGHLVGQTYAEGLLGSVDRLASGLQARTAVIGKLLQPALAAIGGGPASGVPLQRAGTAAATSPALEEHMHLHVDGKSPLIETWQDVIGGWDRMSYLNDRRLAGR